MSDRLNTLLESARSIRSDDAAAAHAVYAEAAALARREHRTVELAHALRHLSDLDRDAGRLTEAQTSADEAVALYRAGDGGLDLANALRLSALARNLGPETDGLWAEALDLYQAAGVEPGVSECRMRLAGT